MSAFSFSKFLIRQSPPFQRVSFLLFNISNPSLPASPRLPPPARLWRTGRRALPPSVVSLCASLDDFSREPQLFEQSFQPLDEREDSCLHDIPDNLVIHTVVSVD